VVVGLKIFTTKDTKVHEGNLTCEVLWDTEWASSNTITTKDTKVHEGNLTYEVLWDTGWASEK